ncbi:altronate dehydratase family protein [Limibacter armeniacum]|uniref:UxaA family hydrolase n=1 Tax=Limibacter armeniacum TaxID=466084 RepID=UPI002FE69BD3
MKAITIHPDDNLAVALNNLPKDASVSVNGNNYTLQENITLKHKFALEDLAAGDELYMYGLVVGTANRPIQKGTAITTENVTHKAAAYDLDRMEEYVWVRPDVSKWENKTFNGYHRTDGQVGTQNIWLVFPLVFCENRNVEVIKKALGKALGYDTDNQYERLAKQLVNQYETGSTDTETVVATETKKEVFDNVKVRFITHQGGCGGIRQDAEALCRLLAGYIKNPNVAGATVLSLGCQNAEVSLFQKALKLQQVDKPVIILDQQQTGKEEDLVSTAIRETFDQLVKANQLTRKPAPLSKLNVGLECGGSDGFSGISANPSVGQAADLIAALGGKVMLAEFPELCGVEQELINRIGNKPLAEKFTGLMRRYEQTAIEAGSGFDMNPSPGNIKDGLITDAMKSAGAARKGGFSPVHDVLDYTEYAQKGGLSLLCTPGNDVESTTALAGSGANMILFTTGLGTPTGNPVAPVIKISSNTQLSERMPDIIDLNAGQVIDGKTSIEQMGEQMLDLIIKVASGEVETKAMTLEQYDFIPWKRGVSL